MPKFLVQASYTVEGLRTLKRENALNRMSAVKEAVKSIGGTLEAIYWALGKDKAVLILDLTSLSRFA